MPHAVIERSGNLIHQFIEHDIDLVDWVHGTLMETGLFELDAIKTREIVSDNWMVGEKGQDGTFVHLCVSIKTGRTLEQRQTLSDTLIAALGEALKTIEVDQITVEIREMDTETYRKFKGL